MTRTYEVRFGVESKRRIQEFRIFTTQASSFSEALQNFIVWANNGEPKFDMRKKPYEFDSYPVTEQHVVSIMRLSF